MDIFPNKILIIKPSSLGDIVTAMPVLIGLRRTFPNAHISWLVGKSFAELLESQPELDELVVFDRRGASGAWRSPRAARIVGQLLSKLRRARYDWVIDLQGLLRTGLFTRSTKAPMRAGFADAREGAWIGYNRRIQVSVRHTMERNVELVRALGVDARVEDMKLTVSHQAMEYAQGVLHRLALRKGGYLVCFLSTRWPTKVYPYRHWASVLAKLSQRVPMVLMGTSGEAEIAARLAQTLGPRVIDLVNQTSIPQMVAMVADSGGVICPDSAANFIAPALGVDVVTLIGPTKVERTGPVGTNVAITAPVPCQGCLRKKCLHMTCMESISPESVAKSAEAMIDKVTDGWSGQPPEN